MPIPALPPAPQPTDPRDVFKLKSFTWVAALAAWTTSVNETNAEINANRAAAEAAEVAANDSAFAAFNSASAAAEDAERLAALNELYLGPLPADPDSGREGAPLVVGNFYVNTVSGAVRAYNGAGWTQGIGAVAGVNSLNGEVGALVKTTLAAYGITDIAIGAKGAIDLDGLITPGMYTFAAATNAPAGVTGGVVFVASDGSVLGQVVMDANGFTFSRCATDVDEAPVFSNWRRAAQHNDVAVPLAGGDINCALGNDFTETVNGNRALAFSNEPSGSYSCVVEINHIAGTLTLPAGCVIANGATLDLSAGKRQLLFFRRVQLGTPGWYVSTLPNFPT